MWGNSVLSAVLCWAPFALSVDVPDYIKPCTEVTDECLTQATQAALPGFVKGIPHLQVPSLDPLIMTDNVTISLPGNLSLRFINGKMYGFRTCIVDKVAAHRDIMRVDFDFHCNLTVKGQYALQGRFLLFHLDTDGHAKIKITNLKIHLDIKESFKKDEQGVVHYWFPSYKFTTDYGESRHLNLTNLFKANPELSASLLDFMNSNSRALAQEFGGPIVDYAVGYSFRVIGKFFDAVPYDQLVHAPLPEKAFS